MWHLLHLIAVVPLGFLLGFFCVLTSIVLYPSEEGKFQSKFEDLWIRVDDYQKLALSRHAAFMTQVAKLETRLLDRIFGSQSISVQFFFVSACLSLASTCGALLMLSPWIYVDLSSAKDVLLRGFVFYFCGPLLLVVAFLLLKNWKARLLLLMLSGALFLVWIVQVTDLFDLSSDSSQPGSVTVTAMFVGGFVSDIAFIAAMRRLLRFAGQMTQSLRVVAAMAMAMIVAACLMSPLLLLLHMFRSGQPDPEKGLAIGAIISFADTFDVILALLFVFLALLLLVHRAVWPLLTRTLFRMTDIGTKGRRGILMTVGLALLTWSGAKLPELVKELVKALGKG